jgi:hypothetical protein
LKEREAYLKFSPLKFCYGLNYNIQLTKTSLFREQNIENIETWSSLPWNICSINIAWLFSKILAIWKQNVTNLSLETESSPAPKVASWKLSMRPISLLICGTTDCGLRWHPSYTHLQRELFIRHHVTTKLTWGLGISAINMDHIWSQGILYYWNSERQIFTAMPFSNILCTHVCIETTSLLANSDMDSKKHANGCDPEPVAPISHR